MKKAAFAALLLWAAVPVYSQSIGSPTFISTLKPDVQPLVDDFYYLNCTPAAYGFNDKVKTAEIICIQGADSDMPKHLKLFFNENAQLEQLAKSLFLEPFEPDEMFDFSEKFKYDETFGYLYEKQYYMIEELQQTQTITYDGLNITRIESTPPNDKVVAYNLDPKRPYEYFTFEYDDAFNLIETEHYKSINETTEIEYWLKNRHNISYAAESKTIEISSSQKGTGLDPHTVFGIIYRDKQKEIRGKDGQSESDFVEILTLNALKQPVKSVKNITGATAKDEAIANYQYNSSNLLVRYTYQSTGNIDFERKKNWAKMSNTEAPTKPTDIKYEINYTYDAKGNWTKIEKKDLVSGDVLIIEATIEY